MSLLGCLGTKEPHLGPSPVANKLQLSVFLPNDWSLNDWYAGVYALPTVWPDVSMLGADNLRGGRQKDFSPPAE